MSVYDSDLVTKNRTSKQPFGQFSFQTPSSTVAQLYRHDTQPPIRDFLHATPAESPTASYDRLVIDAPVQARSDEDPTRLSVNVIPDRFKSIFSFSHFNLIQTACLDDMFRSDRNVIISAPTGSGKTVLMELALLREFSQKSRGKCVYIAPIKSLCTERVKDWERKFAFLKLKCKEFTGDTENSLSELMSVDIIVTTPEKFDSITRRWKQFEQAFKAIHLILMDEVHILHEPRGATLEVVVSRMKNIAREMSNHRMRFVAISATVPNIEDIGEWLQAESGRSDISVRVFGDEYRPVKLKRIVLGCGPGDNYYNFENSLNGKLLSLVEQHSNGKPVLIFCATRKSVVASGKTVLEACQRHAPGSAAHPLVKRNDIAAKLQNCGKQIQNKDLQELLVHGIAFHHAGLCASDKALVEKIFIAGDIRVLSATSTLACGVNLPAHLVIIKGTKTCYGECRDYSTLDMLQMLGRAGRPQFDTSGTVVILTANRDTPKWESLTSGTETIESHLHKKLVEHLNAELGLGTICDLNTAVLWLKATFLYIRVRKNPAHYYELGSSGQLLDKIESFCRSTIELLFEQQCATRGRAGQIARTDLGATMAKYYVKFNTVKRINDMAMKCTIAQVLDVVSQAEEFQETSSTRFDAGDKATLNELNARVKYPHQERISTVGGRVYVLLQCHLGGITIPSKGKAHSMDSEVRVFLPIASRIVKCVIARGKLVKDGITTMSALELLKCFTVGWWDEPAKVLKQVEGLGAAYIDHLRTGNIRSLDDVKKADPRRIEALCKRNPPFGNTVQNAVNALPNFVMQVTKVETLPAAAEYIEILVNISDVAEPFRRKSQGALDYFTFLAYTDDLGFLDFRKMPIAKMPREGKRLDLKLPPSSTGNLNCFVIFDAKMGCDRNVICEITKPVNIALNSPPKRLSIASFAFQQQQQQHDSSEVLADENKKIEAALRTIDTINKAQPNESLSDLIECGHRCADKEACGHVCCKVGKRSKKSQKRLASSTDLSQTVKKIRPVKDLVSKDDQDDFDDFAFDYDDIDMAIYDNLDVPALNLETSRPSTLPQTDIVRVSAHFKAEPDKPSEVSQTPTAPRLSIRSNEGILASLVPLKKPAVADTPSAQARPASRPQIMELDAPFINEPSNPKRHVVNEATPLMNRLEPQSQRRREPALDKALVEPETPTPCWDGVKSVVPSFYVADDRKQPR